MRGLFITGTDTGVGKTVATGLIARQLRQAGVRTGCYKPVCTGSERGADGSHCWSDIDALAAAIGDEFPKDRICPQTFDAPLAPPAAARQEGRDVDSILLRRGVDWWTSRVDLLLVEGVGGLLCPITAIETVADLACDLEFPLLIVSPLVLGTINHTLMTIDVAQHRGLEVAGVLFNDIREAGGDVRDSSFSEIAARTTVPLLGTISYAPWARPDCLRLSPGTMHIDWFAIAGEWTHGDGRQSTAG